MTNGDAGNDPETLGLAFHHQGSTLLQWPNMEVMICLGQGGLRSQSASSLLVYISW